MINKCSLICSTLLQNNVERNRPGAGEKAGDMHAEVYNEKGGDKFVC